MNVNIFDPRPSGNTQQAATIKRWVEEMFPLTEQTSVMVTELHCSEPDCPPIETVIALMTAGSEPRKLKLHKPMADVRREDVERLAGRN